MRDDLLERRIHRTAEKYLQIKIVGNENKKSKKFGPQLEERIKMVEKQTSKVDVM